MYKVESPILQYLSERFVSFRIFLYIRILVFYIFDFLDLIWIWVFNSELGQNCKRGGTPLPYTFNNLTFLGGFPFNSSNLLPNPHPTFTGGTNGEGVKRRGIQVL